MKSLLLTLIILTGVQDAGQTVQQGGEGANAQEEETLQLPETSTETPVLTETQRLQIRSAWFEYQLRTSQLQRLQEQYQASLEALNALLTAHSIDQATLEDIVNASP